MYNIYVLLRGYKLITRKRFSNSKIRQIYFQEDIQKPGYFNCQEITALVTQALYEI